MDTGPPLQPDETPPVTAASPQKTSAPPAKTPRSRAGAVWVGACVATILLIALIVFVLQNTQQVQVTFLAMQGTVSLAIALLIASIVGGIIVLTIGTIRISQLRRRLSYERRS